MNRSLLTFPRGGVHPPQRKDLTAPLPIEPMPAPVEVDVLLLQHFGSPAVPRVAKKDTVVEGDLLGEPSGLGATVHASVSGTVKAIESVPGVAGNAIPAVTIACDRDAAPREYAATDWRRLDRAALLERVRAAGIVGMGGAGFPTHVKLAPPPEARIDTLILNGAECEPYLTTDHRLMLEQPDAVIEGALIMLAILGIRRATIGVESNKMDAVDALRAAAALAADRAGAVRVDVTPLAVKYPQGAEKQLIQSLTGRRVPAGGFPFHVGVIVQNTGTAIAVRDAVVSGKPVTEKVLTVSGRAIRRPANLRVRVGTRVRDIVAYLGGTTGDLARIVAGGPMTGFAISSLDVAVTKTTSGLLFLSGAELDLAPPANCIRCGWCADVCPMGVQPGEIAQYVEAGKAELTAPLGVFECFECGSCTYACPARRPIVQFVRLAKRKARR